MWDEEREAYAHIPLDAAAVVAALQDSAIMETWEPIAVETEYSRPALPGIRFGGVIDLLARDRQTGGVWLVDVKTRTAFGDPEQEEFDMQLASYEAVLHANDIHPLGSQILQVRRTPPRKPSRNLDGSMSRVKLATDWRTYKAALIEAGLNPDRYQDMQAKLSDYELYRHTRVYRSPEEAEAVFQRVVMPVIRQLPFARTTAAEPWRNPRRECTRCAAYPLCSEELRGRDTTFIAETQYVPNLHANG